MINVLKNYWRELPNRDQALDRIYDFLQALSNNDIENAEQMILISSLDDFRKDLHNHMVEFLMMHFEDNEFEDLSSDLSIKIADPYKIDENLISPEFSGKTMVLDKNEKISVRVGYKDIITMVRLNFQISESDEVYFLKFVSVENEPF